MNNLVPSFENAMPVGMISCTTTETESIKVRVETSKGADSAYSFTALREAPITNILVPSLENVMPVGERSCDLMEVASTNVRVEASKVPTMRLPDVSLTAPGSIVSSCLPIAATAARCAAFRVNEIVAPSAVVSSSSAVRVTPCV